jgi:hypothetical protein
MKTQLRLLKWFETKFLLKASRGKQTDMKFFKYNLNIFNALSFNSFTIQIFFYEN